MTTTLLPPEPPEPPATTGPGAARPGGLPPSALGPMGRLGRWTATHVRAVVLIWVALAIGLGAFAPRVEHALSGAGWEASGSESVQAREAIDRTFAGQGR